MQNFNMQHINFETSEWQNHTVKGILNLYITHLNQKIICATPDNYFKLLKKHQRLE